MYQFIDVNEVSEGRILPSEALKINGEYIETLIPEYRTLTVSGREALSPEITSYETGSRDGATLKGKRYPARTIIVKYQLIAETNEAFRAAYNKLAAILNVEEAELIFNDEPDKFFTGTPSSIGEVEPGRNSVVGEFELFCADPFKYSVVEYEAEPETSTGGFLIDYNGTYKAFPRLEAEFYNEDEGQAALTGNGDCGYVAFFNEKEKIIQLGSLDETNAESYEKSQTLVNQKFQSETAWGTIAETNWATNIGRVADSANVQAGNVAMTPAYYKTTTAPSTSGTLLKKQSALAKPHITYEVTAKTTGRTEKSVDVEVTIKATHDKISNSGSIKIEKGAEIKLNNTKIWVSSDATKDSGTKTGTFYLWDASVVKKRIRITNSKQNVGKSGQVVAWVNVSDIGATTTANPLDKGIGLKGAIQLGGGDWNYAIIKNENTAWGNDTSHSVKLTVKVKNLQADTTLIEDIKFKVERTDDVDNKIGLLDEIMCNDLELSTYTAPVPGTWYLMPETYGTASAWHGPSITRTIPADAAGVVGAKNFTLSYRQKMAIGNSSSATQEMGMFQAMLISGSGSDRKIVAGVNIYKNANGKNANLRFYVNGSELDTMQIDLSMNNKYFGNDKTGLETVKNSTITKTGNKIEFNIGGIQKSYLANGKFEDVAVTEVTFYIAKYGTKPELSFNGLYWAKFVKNNCDTWADIPNKFSANDIVTVDCRKGEVFLNDNPCQSLGALGNDWEDFFLSPGLNQIGVSYSSWVEPEYAPIFKVKYREVFL